MSSPIGDLLLEALEKAGMSQSQLSTRTKYSRSTINLIISGKRRLKLEHASKIYQHCKKFDFWKAINLIIEEDFKSKGFKLPKR